METIKIYHYLNKKLKPIDYGLGDKFYPVYVRLLIGREVYRFRSPAFNTGKGWLDYYVDLENINDDDKNKIKNETKLIRFIVENSEKLDENKSIVDNIKILNTTILHILDIDYHITYFNTNEDGTGGINYFDFIDNFFCSFLEYKTNIDNKFFTAKKLMHTIWDYQFLNDEFLKYIPIIEIRERYIIAKKMVEFIDTKYTNEVFNIYEWYFNNGKSNFLDFMTDVNIDKNLLNNIIESIDYNCKIRLFEADLEDL